MEEHKFKKEYQLWRSEGLGMWFYEEYDTIEECISAEKHGMQWIISRRANFRITGVEIIEIKN